MSLETFREIELLQSPEQLAVDGMFASTSSSHVRSTPAYAAWTGGVLADPARSIAVRLFCFPCAGAGASAFREWQHGLPRTVGLFPIQLPGREGRFMELAHNEFRPLIETLALALVPLLDVPFAFFGHSMGAIIAFELARELRRTVGTQPVHLFVAGARAPHLPDRDIPNRYLSDADFVARLRHWNGIPREVLETPELLRIVLPTLRKDVILCETYAHRFEKSLDCPITVFGGRADEKLRAGELAAWRVHAQGRFTLRFLPGGHFFTVTARAELLAHLRKDLHRLVTGDA